MSKEIMDAISVRRALIRMSHEILESNHGSDDLVLVGIETRGKYLAEMIRDNIASIEGVNVPCYALNISAYRDDEKKRDVKIGAMDIKDKVVVLVDDVLYTGRTIRAALDALIDQGRPACVRLAVLVDRGHRQLPIRADMVGKNVPTSSDESVDVKLESVHGACGVYLNA